MNIHSIEASTQRVKSAWTNRPTSAGQELRQLREQVTSLQQDLVLKNIECQKANDQLNVLVSMVKRAWSGDLNAAKHVANIVGAAPPDFRIDEQQHLHAKVKSPAINHWAVLTIGLLNRYYKEQERHMLAEQHEYLNVRSNWLEEQLLYNRDQTLRLGLKSHSAGPKRSVSKEDYNAPRTSPVPMANNHAGQPNLLVRRHSASEPSSRPPSGKTKKTGPRPIVRKQPSRPESDLKWEDLVTDPTKQDKHTNGSQHSSPEKEEGYRKDDRGDIPYDDPYRYTKYGLYDNEHLSHLKKRPGSGKQQRTSDSKRSRPKSAAVTGSGKQERPLKFETTRPVSAPKSHSCSGEPKGRGKVKVTGSKVGIRDRDRDRLGSNKPPIPSINSEPTVNFANEEEDEDYMHSGDLALEEVNYDEFLNPPREKTKEEKEIESLIHVDIRKPKSVIQYEGDLQELQEMEQNFRRTTLDLQKKLGLPADGLV